tara:strand:+ start:373 stop:627 length:255 start_codon:yes stop_codon:yes gene_type:complete
MRYYRQDQTVGKINGFVRPGMSVEYKKGDCACDKDDDDWSIVVPEDEDEPEECKTVGAVFAQMTLATELGNIAFGDGDDGLYVS